MTHTSYVDSDHYEEADSALRGALALDAIISDASPGGENANHWATHVMEDLEMARRILLNSARSSLNALWQENWRAHALLGKYGPETKAHVEAQVAARCGKEAHA
jgi:hypothetical protein